MDGVLDEVCKALGAQVLFLVVCNISLLLQHVVKSGGPLPAAQPSCVAAVVNHESYSPSMHVWVQGVHSLRVGYMPKLYKARTLSRGRPFRSIVMQPVNLFLLTDTDTK